MNKLTKQFNKLRYKLKFSYYFCYFTLNEYLSIKKPIEKTPNAPKMLGIDAISDKYLSSSIKV